MAEETVAGTGALATGELVPSTRSSATATKGRGVAIRRWEPPRWSVWVAVAVVAVANLIVAWDSTGLIYQADEAGMIFNAALFARPDGPVVLLGSSYMPGLAILIAPLWLLTDEAATVYRMAIFLNAAIGVATIWPMSRVARKFGAGRNASVLMAAVIAVSPAMLIQSNYLLAENLLHFVVMLTAWAAIVQLRNPSFRQAALLGASAGAMFLVHGRALPLLVVVAVGFAVMLFKRPVDALGGGGLLATISVASYVLLLWIEEQNYLDADRTAGQVDQLLAGSPADYATAVISQTWVESFAWLGLAGVGLLVLGVRARRGAHRFESRWLLAAIGAAIVFVVMTLAGGTWGHTGDISRIDAFVYGRYIEVITPVLAVIGIAALAARLSRTIAWAVVGIAAVSGALLLLVVVPLMPVGGRWEGSHTPAVAAFLSDAHVGLEQRDAWWAIVLAGVAATALVVFAGRRSPWALPAVGALFLTWSLYGDQGVLKEHEYRSRMAPPSLVALESVPDSEPLSVDLSQGPLVRGFNQIEFWVYPRELSVFSYARGDTPRSSLAITGVEESLPVEQGAWPLNGSLQGVSIIWVYPGELRDALDAEGRVAHPAGE